MDSEAMNDLSCFKDNTPTELISSYVVVLRCYRKIQSITHKDRITNEEIGNRIDTVTYWMTC